jgi:hypothetical protein
MVMSVVYRNYFRRALAPTFGSCARNEGMGTTKQLTERGAAALEAYLRTL